VKGPTIALVGTHDPAFGRVAILAAGLRAHNVDVVTCVETVWGGTQQRVAAAQRGALNPNLVINHLRAYAHLAGRIRALRPQPDALLVGYPGQLDVLVLSALLPRVPIVLDAFVGIDETLADRGIGSPGSPTRTLARVLDRLAFQRAGRVVVDTRAHARRFAADYGLVPEKAVVAPVGAFDPGLVNTTAIGGHSDGEPEALRVLYFGGFIPLHGVSTILDAAQELGPHAGIRFDLVGDGQDADEAERQVARERLTHVRVTRAWMPESELVARHIAAADVCLGIFGDRPKTADVVPAKLYLALASARTVVTADTPAIREEIMARASSGAPPLCGTRPGDGADLAAALVRLRDDPALRRSLAVSGRRLYEERFTPAGVTAQLAQVIAGLSAPR
jgi:glycosyltransferase involved in cell wall biosynthesis